ncbi:unknown protein [Nostoc sp. NIES-3756]|uniref:hypothetical protein n=1 Tax=Nostoc sp. NIES-3756 TaxID=1751286 RepID=UPI000720BAFF|nr:hypothetical protein [Nostoc sp. NIES-3756]BAT52047.1 unknown protein [Nostoc sp. NIES-3756]
MSILFSPKIRLLLGVAAFSFVGIASSVYNNYSQAKQLEQKPQDDKSISLNQQVKPKKSQLSIDQSATHNTQISTNFWQKTGTTQTEIVSQNRNQQNSPNLITQLATTSITYPIIDEWRKYKFSVDGDQILSPSQLPTAKVNVNQADLLAVLVNTRQYFQEHASDDPDILRPGLLSTQKVTTQDILKTLDFMIAVLKEDIANNRITRLQNPNFINRNFRVIKWTAYNPENQVQKQLRITKYAVFTHPGSRKRTATFNTPIYSLKDNNLADKFYTRYTKQDVLSGIYEPGGKEYGKVEPLAYLTRNGLEEALMQGTILVNFTDGTRAFFNVDRNNGMSYVRGLKATAQKRYWYFRQVDAIKGYGHKIDAKISVKPGVTFAGDVLNIGLGRIVLLEHTQGGRKQLQMGVIADTGGAFLPNLHQLDFLSGVFPSQNSFRQYIRQLPEYATVYFLVKK